MDLDEAKHSSLGNLSLWLPSDHRLPALRLTEEPRQPIRHTYLSTLWLAGNELRQWLLHHGASLWLSAPGAGPAGAGRSGWYQTPRPVLVLPLLIHDFLGAANSWIMDSLSAGQPFFSA